MASPKKSVSKGRWTKPMGELHILLANAFPEARTAKYDVLDVEWLAKKLKVTDEGVYTWLRNNALPFKRAEQIVGIDGCRKKLKDFLPYISR